MKPKSSDERRARPRGAHERQATTLIQAILVDPGKTASDLATDLRAGGDSAVTAALLNAAEGFAKLRGIDITAQIEAVRTRLTKARLIPPKT